MLNFTTRGNVLKAEFLWTIQNTFHWPTDSPISHWNSPTFYAEKDEEIKWGLNIMSNYPPPGGLLFLTLRLAESPANETTVTARICATVTDEEKGKLLRKQQSSVVPLAVDTRNYGQPKISIGYYQDLQVIPSVSIRVIVEYEKHGQVKTTTSYTGGASSLFVKRDPNNSWSADFEKLFLNQSGSDICFIVSGREITAHKLVLSARSPVFEAMFNSDMKEKTMDRIDIPDIAPEIFNALLRFIYTDQVKLTETNAEPLLAVANQYLLPLLKSNCEEFIMRNLTIENCIEMFMLADLHNAPNLKRTTAELFHSHRTEIRKTKGWKTLKISHPDVACEVLENLLCF